MGKVSPTTLRVLALLAVFALTVAFFSTQIDNYLNARLFNRTSTSVAIIALIAVGQAFVVLTRNPRSIPCFWSPLPLARALSLAH
jgi:rhamnose transport system permease protein